MSSSNREGACIRLTFLQITIINFGKNIKITIWRYQRAAREDKRLRGFNPWKENYIHWVTSRFLKPLQWGSHQFECCRMTRTHEVSEDAAQSCLGIRGTDPERREPQAGVPKSTYKLSSNPWMTPELCMCVGDSKEPSLKQYMEHRKIWAEISAATLLIEEKFGLEYCQHRGSW